jgi:hypothetical protein
MAQLDIDRRTPPRAVVVSDTDRNKAERLACRGREPRRPSRDAPPVDPQTSSEYRHRLAALSPGVHDASGILFTPI